MEPNSDFNETFCYVVVINKRLICSIDGWLGMKKGEGGIAGLVRGKETNDIVHPVEWCIAIK